MMRAMQRGGLDRRLRHLRASWHLLRKGGLGGGRVARFLGHTARRFVADGCPRLAAGLSYASLLALVPLAAIALAMLAAFPAFEGLRTELQSALVEGVVPGAGLGAAAGEHFARFVENATKLTGPGILGLAVTAVLLLANIDGALNTIWRVADRRPFALQIVVYWTLLTLGPLFLGSSVSLSSYAFAAVQIFGIEDALGGLAGLSRAVSVALAALGFAVMYFVVPNRRLNAGPVIAGGVTAALLFEVLKAAFGLYVKHFPSYQAVYGAVSALPLFLVWLYLT